MIQLVVTAVITVGLALIKGALSLVKFLLRIITTIVRLLLSVLPVTGIALLVTGVYLIWFSFTGVDPLPVSFPFHPDGKPFLASVGSIILLWGDLSRSWPGILSVIVLIAAVILCVPVLFVLILVHAFIALLPVFIILPTADLVVFVIYGIIARKSPFAQIRDRFYILFPVLGDRHYEKNYHAWLKRHADEFADDTFGTPGRYAGDGYGPDDRYRENSAYDPAEEEDETAAVSYRRRKGRRPARLSRMEKRRRRIEDYYEEYEDDAYGDEPAIDYEDDFAPYDDEDAYIEDEAERAFERIGSAGRARRRDRQERQRDDAERARRDREEWLRADREAARAERERAEEILRQAEEERRAHAAERRRAEEARRREEERRRAEDARRREEERRRAEERRREEERRHAEDERRRARGGRSGGTSFDFFAGCRDLAGVEKKYRSLVKIYHPDNQDGDTTAIQEINAQYAEAKRRFS